MIIRIILGFPHQVLLKMDNFYIILPSNSNAKDYLNNNASKYIVSWQNAIELRDMSKWRVALSEISFYFPHVSATKNYGFKYLRRVGDFSIHKRDIGVIFDGQAFSYATITGGKIPNVWLSAYSGPPKGLSFSSNYFFRINSNLLIMLKFSCHQVGKILFLL